MLNNIRPKMIIPRLNAVVFSIAVVFSFPALAEIIISSEIEEDNILSRSDLIGVRAFTPSIASLIKGKVFGIPSDVFYLAADTVPSVKAALEIKGMKVREVPVSKVIKELGVWRSNQVSAYKGAIFKSLKDLKGEKFYLGKNQALLKTYKGTFGPKFVSLKQKSKYPAHYGAKHISSPYGFDLVLVSSIVNTELFSNNKIDTFFTGFGEKKREFVKIKPGAGAALYDVMGKLVTMKTITPAITAKGFYATTSKLKKYSKLYDLATTKIGTITFGRPQFFTPEQLDVKVQKVFLDRFDIYVAIFGMSDRHFFEDSVSETVFAINLPQGAIALELIPLKFGPVTAVKIEKSSPKVKGSIGRVRLELGQYFKQTVSFETLKPTIVGLGINENNIAWLMKDEAAGPGAKKFVAVIGLPIGTKKIMVEMSTHTLTKDYFIDELKSFFKLQGDIASSTLVTHQVILPR